MKTISINLDQNYIIKNLILLFLISIILLTTFGCSSSKDNVKNKTNRNEKVLLFTDKSDNDWKVTFEDDEISSAIRNGKKLSEEEIDKNEDLILDELNDIYFKKFDKEIKIDVDLRGLSESLETLRRDLKDIDIEINVDKDELKREMEELKKNLDDQKFEIDEDLLKNLKDLEENLKDLEFGKNKLKIRINNMNGNLSHIPGSKNKIKINIPPIPKIDLTEVNLISEFVKKMKNELVKDNLMSENENDFDVELKKDALIVNGKEAPKDLFTKYKSLYENHFDKDLTKSFTFRSH